jgi:plastocyanin
MRKAIFAAVIFGLIVANAVMLFGGATSGQNTDYNMAPMTETTVNGTTGNTPRSQAGDNVVIQNFAFSPATITVSRGATVTWTNDDTTPHTVTTDTSGGPDSGQIQPGQTFSFTFNTTGTFRYHCSIHPQMTGTVVVRDGNSPTTPSTTTSSDVAHQSPVLQQPTVSSTEPASSTNGAASQSQTQTESQSQSATIPTPSQSLTVTLTQTQSQSQTQSQQLNSP